MNHEDRIIINLVTSVMEQAHDDAVTLAPAQALAIVSEVLQAISEQLSRRPAKAA